MLGVAAPYDLIAARWAEDRTGGRFREKPYVDLFARLASAGAHILDLGFGIGWPIGRYLLNRGFPLTGVDASREMLRLGAQKCPEAELVAQDILHFRPDRRFGGIVAWDCIFHIPKTYHAGVFQSMHDWLEPGGPLLLSVGGSEDEFTDLMFGVEFFYSAHAPSRSVALLQECGFEIVVAEIDDPSSRGHMAIVCLKSG